MTHSFDISRANSYNVQCGGQSIRHSTISFEYKKLGHPNIRAASLSKAERALWGPSTQPICKAIQNLLYRIPNFLSPIDQNNNAKTCTTKEKITILAKRIASNS
jgi:hypothetical protein